MLRDEYQTSQLMCWEGGENNLAVSLKELSGAFFLSWVKSEAFTSLWWSSLTGDLCLCYVRTSSRCTMLLNCVLSQGFQGQFVFIVSLECGAAQTLQQSQISPKMAADPPLWGLDYWDWDCIDKEGPQDSLKNSMLIHRGFKLTR